MPSVWSRPACCSAWFAATPHAISLARAERPEAAALGQQGGALSLPTPVPQRDEAERKALQHSAQVLWQAAASTASA